MDTVIEMLLRQGVFWYIAEVGILLEITGAWYIVQGSFRASRRIQRVFSGLQGLTEIPRIKGVLQNQAKTELTGFLLLGTGLLMQLIGGFGG